MINEHKSIKRHCKIEYRPVGRRYRVGLGSEKSIQILGRSNRTQCRQRFATAAIFPQKKLAYPEAMTRKWAPQTRYTLLRNTVNIEKFGFDS